MMIRNGRFLQPAEGDQTFASLNGKPLAVARSGSPPQVAWGFQPLAAELRFEVSTPLLFANSFRWLVAGTALPEELSIGSTGSVLLSGLDLQGEAPRVVDARGNALPVSKANDGWRFFAGASGVYQIRQGQAERMVSLTLPQSPKSFWKPGTEQMLTSLPAASGTTPPTRWWIWLTVFGLLCLVADALLFDRRDWGNGARTATNPFTALLTPVRQLLRRKEARPRHGV